jgi:hypothetical protein
MADSISIILIKEIPKVSPLGVPTHEIQVEFKVGTHGPFFITISKEDFLKGFTYEKIHEYAQKVLGLLQR